MKRLQQRLENGEVVLLDGAIGTELQAMGVPMDQASWCGKALSTHPDTIRQLHEDYIKAGAEIITANTFSSARHNLAATGLGDKTRELNALAVKLAMEARDTVAAAKAVYVAGSMSTYGTTRGTLVSPQPSTDEAEDNYKEQGEILAEAGADLLMLEMMTEIEQATMCLQGALSTGLPVWIGFSVETSETGELTMFENPQNTAFIEGLETLISLGGSVVTVMHSEIKDTTPGLKVVQEKWVGPVGSYPNSGRWTRPDWVFDNLLSPEDYLRECKGWVEMGVQIIGGCCGIGREHIALLAERLPSRIPS